MLLHAELKKRITEPGIYACPYLTPNEETSVANYRNQPLYQISYRGYTHGTVPGFLSLGVLSFLLTPMLAAWLLTMSSRETQATYLRRFLFVIVLGLFLSLGSDWLRALTDEHTTVELLKNSLGTLIAWGLIGLVLAWRIKPKTA